MPILVYHSPTAEAVYMGRSFVDTQANATDIVRGLGDASNSYVFLVGVCLLFHEHVLSPRLQHESVPGLISP